MQLSFRSRLQRELVVLSVALEKALSGQGQLGMMVEEPSTRPRNEGAVEESLTGKLRTMSGRSTLLLPRCANVDTIFRPVLA